MESDLVLQSQGLPNKPALETNQMYNKAAAYSVWEGRTSHFFFFFLHRKKLLEKEIEGD